MNALTVTVLAQQTSVLSTISTARSHMVHEAMLINIVDIPLGKTSTYLILSAILRPANYGREIARSQVQLSAFFTKATTHDTSALCYVLHPRAKQPKQSRWRPNPQRLGKPESTRCSSLHARWLYPRRRVRYMVALEYRAFASSRPSPYAMGRRQKANTRGADLRQDKGMGAAAPSAQLIATLARGRAGSICAVQQQCPCYGVEQCAA